MVKTKRTFARTAVLASAALALSARGADAAKAFQPGCCGTAPGDLFPSGSPLDCSLLWFDTSTGLLMDYLDGEIAGLAGAAARGLAVDDNGGSAPTDINHCKAAPGAYLHTAALGTLAAANTNADGLKVFKSPAGWYAAGGQNFVGGAAVAVAPASLASSSTNVGSTTVDECAAGTTSNAGAEYCGIIIAGYYGTAGAGTAPAYTSAASPTACSATFSGATAAGITSAQLTTGSNLKTACVTLPGYIITSAANVADGSITVAQTAAGKYAVGGTPLATSNAANAGTGIETASTCAANTYSAAGAASCTACPTGQTSAAGASACAAASPTAADSAGASTPIAVALAAAAAVPLLL